MNNNIKGVRVQNGAPQFLSVARAIIRYWQTSSTAELEIACSELGFLLRANRCAILRYTDEYTPQTVVASWKDRKFQEDELSLIESWPMLEHLFVFDDANLFRLRTCILNVPRELILVPIKGGQGCVGALVVEVEEDQCLDVDLDFIRTVSGLLGFAMSDAGQNALSDQTDVVDDVPPGFSSGAFDRSQSMYAVDELTGLMGRQEFRETVGRFVEYSSEKECFGAFFLIDLDDFRFVNDSEGHAVGDQCLVGIASRLMHILPPDGALARLGSDVFALASPQLGPIESEARESAAALAERIHQTLSRPFYPDSPNMFVTASIGVALFYNYASTFEELLRHSELAMFKAKEDGKNRNYFFSTQLQRAINERADLDSALKLAIREKQFNLNYQIQVDRYGAPIGVEALIRWHRPGVGNVSPGIFIPFAEDNGLILDIGRWVLREACRQLALWSSCETPIPELIIAVNVSSEQFKQASFVHDVMSALDDSGAPASRLKLELTESALAQNLTEVKRKMLQLKELGVRFSLDDFGKGYSSLQYIKDLPFDELKIDQSFVRGMTQNRTDKAIASMMLSLAESIGLSALAEGIETEEEFDLLLNMGCPSYQGYLFGFPDEPEAVVGAVLASSFPD